MSLLDDLIPKTAQEEMFDKVDGELFEKLVDLTFECNIDITDVPLEFKDSDFLKCFFKKFSIEEQKKYLLTTYNYERNRNFDPKFLLVFRRAIYTDYAKNENFWSTEFNEVRFGLRNEQPIGSPIRLYSSIMVTTMDKLINHGIVSLDHGGATDGEISISANKTFNDFLFVYKPYDEIITLNQYISSGGISYEDLIEELNKTTIERQQAQGYHR